MATSKSIDKRLKNKRARQALKNTEDVSKLSGGLVQRAGYGSGLSKGDFGRESSPLRNQKNVFRL